MSGRRAASAVVLVVLARVLDVAVLARLPLPGADLDLTLIVVVALALLAGSRVGLIAGLAAGLLADLTPPAAELLGTTALAYGLGGALAGRGHRSRDRSLLQPVLAAAAAAVVSTVVRVAVATLQGAGPDVGSALALVGTAAAYAVVGSLVVVPVIVAVHRRESEQQPAVRW